MTAATSLPSLIEKAEQTLDKEKAQELSERLKQNKFDLNDLLDQMQQIRRMGPIKDIIKMLPGVGRALEGISVQFGHDHAGNAQKLVKISSYIDGILTGHGIDH